MPNLFACLSGMRMRCGGPSLATNFFNCRGCPCPAKARNGTSTATPNRAGVGQAAAQAPSRPARQLRKMAEVLGPCVKFSTSAPPPSPARQHRLRLGAMSSGPFGCSDGPKSSKPFPSPRQGKHRFNLCTSSTAKVPEFALQFWKSQQSLSRPHPHKKECFNMKPSDVFGKLRHTSTVERMTAEARRGRLLSSARRAPNSQHPAGSRLWHGGRLLGNTLRGEWGGRSRRCFGNPEVWEIQCRDCPGSQLGLHGASFAHTRQGECRKAPSRQPPSTGQKTAAAQAPSSALQLRKIAVLLGPCLKKFSTRAPPPQPGT